MPADQSSPGSMVLADIPERQRLRELTRDLEKRRDEIGDLDLNIEILRDKLATFEATYHARLAPEHDMLRRIHNLTRHSERWVELLRRHGENPAAKAHRIEKRRARELNEGRPKIRTPLSTQHSSPQAEQSDAPPRGTDATNGGHRLAVDAQESAPTSRDERLKSAYRALARRFHPDLARTEQERVQFSETMTRINALYRAADIARLEAMHEQAKGGEIDDPDLSLEGQQTLLSERLDWFNKVLESLNEEYISLQKSSTCELMQQVERAEREGQDLIGELKADLSDRVERALSDVRLALKTLETEVNRFNKSSVTAVATPTANAATALDRIFDPYANKKMVRLGLEQLASRKVSHAGHQMAQWLEQQANERPTIVRLILMTYASEMSQFPLEGLESYDDLEARLMHLRDTDEDGVDDGMSLQHALLDLDDLLEYGVRKATTRIVHTGLRFRSEPMREAVPVAIQTLRVRRLFCNVLRVLGAQAHCEGCDSVIFSVPLYRTRGLDDLRASVCPTCGHVLRSYWMPKGKDIQAVLNKTFVDFEIVSEWTFAMGRQSISMQLVPCQVEAMTVGNLKQRFVDEVFRRHEVAVAPKHVQLRQYRKRVPERTPLAELERTRFSVVFSDKAETSLSDALEIVRHRIRNRFRAG